MARILILGGTADARRLAGKLAARGGLDVTLSMAGRTANPVAQPVPVRSGGFGGAEGLAAYLDGNRIGLLIDATHPYAARISANAAAAGRMTGVPVIALRRPHWEPVDGDSWTLVDTAEDAVLALGPARKKVFLALGRQEIGPFEKAAQHSYVVRSVDPIEPPLAVPDAAYILARGPFAEQDEIVLLTDMGINAIVCKNSGGPATYGKIAAARQLGITVIMLKRPDLPDVPAGETVDEVAAMVDHALAPAEKRGV